MVMNLGQGRREPNVGPGTNKKKGLPSKLPLFFPDFDVISKKKQKKVFIAKFYNVLQILIYSPEKKKSFAIARPDLSVFYCDGPRGVFRGGGIVPWPPLLGRQDCKIASKSKQT